MLMKSLGRQLKLSDDQKIALLDKTVNKIEKMQMQRFMAADSSADQAANQKKPDEENEEEDDD